ncbi:MAG TPA: 50S ribosomal protein L30 [candidate division Zixibacteria bacterium]|jgi:large subunit ribosomal protein L30
MSGKLKITYIRSTIRGTVRHKRTIKALGFRKLYQTVEHGDTPTIRGMIRTVAHLVKVEPT